MPHKIYVNERLGVGTLMQLIGVVALFLFFPLGILIGMALLFIGHHRCRFSACSECRSRVHRDALACPNCASRFTA